MVILYGKSRQLFTSTGITKKKRENKKQVRKKGEQNEYNGNSFLSSYRLLLDA
jgi:hypothetical protein